MDYRNHWSFAAFSEISSKLPFRIRSCGYVEVYPEILQSPRTLYSLELIWGVSGVGKITFPEGTFLLHPDEVCYYLPGETHIIEVPPCGFHYWWIAFEGPLVLDFWRGFKIARIPHSAGECPRELFAQLLSTIKKKDDESILCSLADGIRILTLSIADRCNRGRPARGYAELAKSLIDMEFTEPDINVNIIAESLSIHRVYLNRCFSGKYGINISRYLICKRLQYAMRLLLTTSMAVNKIAAKSGFSDAIYFTRFFHHLTGSPPGQFRKNSLHETASFFPEAFLRATSDRI